jgi:hypothetical protein
MNIRQKAGAISIKGGFVENIPNANCKKNCFNCESKCDDLYDLKLLSIVEAFD